MPASPGPTRRAVAGAFYVLAGFGFLLRRPRLWPFALLPALVAAVCLGLGLIAGIYASPRLESALGPVPGRVPVVVGLAITVTVWIATLTAALALGLGLSLLLAAPVLDRLARETEALARGPAPDAARGLRWEVAQSLRGALYFVVRAPGVLVLGLVPVVGPALSAFWAGHALAFQLTDPTLARRGLDFAGRRAWHRRVRAESLGFGLSALLVLAVPCANLLLVPALVVGGTLLVLDLTEAPA